MGKIVTEGDEGNAQVGETITVVLAAQNVCGLSVMRAGAMQWFCQWESLNWKVNGFPVWRSKDWQLLLNRARETPLKLGRVKAHAKTNQPAIKRNQKADQLTKIRKTT